VKNFRFLFLLPFLAACTPPAPALSVSPNGAVLTLIETATLTASLQNTSVQSEIGWTSTGGVLSATTGSSVTFRAEQEGVYKVTATAFSDPSLTRTITVTVGQEARAAAADTPSLSATIAAGQSQTFIVKPASFSKAALYFELSGAPLMLSLYSQSGERIASSNNPNYFSRNPGNLLTAQAISTARTCRGPCIITPARNQGYIVRVENLTAAPVSYDLFIYNENFTDSLENSEDCSPSFNSFLLESAITVGPPEPIVRAIETVTDEDCFFSEEAKIGTVTLATFADTALEVEVDVYQVLSSVNTRRVGSLSAGPGRDDDILKFSFDYPVLIVAKSGDGRAGPSGSSRYAVNYY
jgi:hypothetical protein